MRVLISADMEGATGVTGARDVEVGSSEWQEARRWFTNDVLAALTGLRRAGADEVIVNEAHASCRNLLIDKLPNDVTVIRGRPKFFGMMEGIQSRPDAVAFVGYHGAAGSEGVLSHTHTHRPLVAVLLDGEPAGEGALNAMLAAEFGVPVVLVTGDSTACDEAGRYAPDAETAVVKTSLGRYSAACLALEVSYSLIEMAASRCLANRTPLPATSGPHVIELEFAVAGCADVVSAIPGVEVLTPRRVRFSLPSAGATYRCFRAVVMLAGTTLEGE